MSFMEKFKIKIGILLLGMITLTPLVITSAFGAIIKQFSGVPIPTIQMTATIPNLGILIFSIVVGRLAMSVPVKRLAQIGLGLISLGGLLPIVFHSTVTELLIWAFIMGIGLGFTGSAGPTLISMYFSGDERMSLMGMMTSFNSIGRMIFVIIGGYLGATSWYNTYWVFLLVVVLLVLFSILVPLDTVDKADVEKQAGAKKVSTVQMLKEVSKFVVAFMVSFFYSVYPTNLSIIVKSKNLGGTEVAGLINGLGTIGGLVAGFTMKYTKKALKNFILPVGFTVTGLAFFAILYTNEPIILIVASMFTNIGTAFIFATLPFMVSILSHPARIAMGMAVMNVLNSLGKTICPIVLGWFHVAAGEQQFLVGGAGFVVVGLVLLLTNFGARVQQNRFKKVES